MEKVVATQHFWRARMHDRGQIMWESDLFGTQAHLKQNYTYVKN